MKQTVLYKRLAMMFFAIIIMSQAFAQNQLTEQIQRRAAALLSRLEIVGAEKARI